MSEPLDAFLIPVRAWFSETFGNPTRPQALGWPHIQAGEHTLILAPTGSGKTLAAFLWGINRLYEELAATEEATRPASDGQGVRILYVSPLKALNNDIERNLRFPLTGIRSVAKRQGSPLPHLRCAVRTGDTSGSARASMVRNPPHILITTPESLYLILTSPKAREMLRTVHTFILDEIHTLCGNKRGAHLALSLERLEHLASGPIQRIGLSATQRPLEEVARFLGGQEWRDVDPSPERGGESRELAPRPVAIVDAGHQKALDLQVVTVVPDFREMPLKSIWPLLIPRLAELIRQHHTTLIFANSRRLAERTADRINEQVAYEAREEGPPGSSEALAPGGIPKDLGIFATGTSGPICAHHGSMSRAARQRMEEDLKGGRLPALVCTGSLELGIDIGPVDLVVQLQSPKGVARGLQRVGRSGHLVGQTSKGRIFATHGEDLVEAAAVARGMLRGEVEATQTPQNPLDVLAQQVVAAVALDDWDVTALYDLVRQSYPYHDLSIKAFHAVLDMLAGKYPAQVHRQLRPRISWDRVNDRLSALPGSKLLAVTNSGTIPDRGTFGAYLADGKTKIGELDEEFVYETRIGDAFLLGSQVWRAIEITDDRIIVSEAAGSVPRMPFWRGDYPWRPYELGLAIGRLRREVAERLVALPPLLSAIADPKALAQERKGTKELLDWLQSDCALDENSARNVIDYVRRQLDATGGIASDRTIVVEHFRDALGDPRLVVHSPFGGRVNGPWGLALASVLREHTGVAVEMQSSDDGVLLRFPEAEGELPRDIVALLGPEEARQRILQELPDSALFAALFRQNAARALLMPRRKGGRRTPFWLQRLKARDLLQLVRRFDDFPIVAETYRDCLRDVLDLAHLEEVLRGIQEGHIRVVTVERASPSPAAASLLFDFINVYMYEGDVPKAERRMAALALDRSLLDDLLKGVDLAQLLRPEAIQWAEAFLQRTGPESRARSAEELAVLLLEMGDLSTVEVAARCAGDAAAWLETLAQEGRVLKVELPTASGPARRWVPAELYAQYRAAFGLTGKPPASLPAYLAASGLSPDEAREALLRRFLAHHTPLRADDILSRYDFPRPWLEARLAKLAADQELLCSRFTPEARGEQWCDRRVLEDIHRRTLTILRREVRPVPLASYVDFLTRWQHLAERERLAGPDGLKRVLQQLRGTPAPGVVWERDLLPGRLGDFTPAGLEALCRSGEVVWVGSGSRDPSRGRICFLFRGEGAFFLDPEPDVAGLSEAALTVRELLKSEGACFTADLQSCLGLPLEEINAALVELVMVGLVTNDTLQAMREVISFKPSSPRRPFSSLEVELAERLGERRPSQERVRRARRKVARRMRQEPHWAGRWSLVHHIGVWGQEASEEERIERQARQLLARYGVVTRESLEGEEWNWEWPLLYRQFQLMEMRGELRRGYFVKGLPGVQYALPEALERLREVASDFFTDGEPPVLVLNACDPVNIYGPALKGGPQTARGEPLCFARLPSTYLVLWQGWPLMVSEASGSRMTTVRGIEAGILRQALEAWVASLPLLARRITLTEWDGVPACESGVVSWLERLGFYHDGVGMTWEAQ
jgi:ATP-dependent Lhr-like helicase